MRISELFKKSSERSLIIKTFLEEESTARTLLGEGMSLPAENADDRDMRAFHAFAYLSDPTFTDDENGNKYLEWICKGYANRALKKNPVKTEDLSALREELDYFDKSKDAFKSAGHPTDIREYASLKHFSEVAPPFGKTKKSPSAPFDTGYQRPDNYFI